MIEVEKMGKPAVPIVSGRFEGDAISSSRAFAMPDLRFVLVPRIYRNLPNDECVRQTELAFDDLVQALTNETDGAVGQHGIDTEGAFRFEGDDRFDAVQRMNEDFIGRDWGRQLPVAARDPGGGGRAHRRYVPARRSPGLRYAPRVRAGDGGEDRHQRGDGRGQTGAYAGDNRGGQGALPGWRVRRQVAADVHQRPRAHAGGQRPHRQRGWAEPQGRVWVRGGTTG